MRDASQITITKVKRVQREVFCWYWYASYKVRHISKIVSKLSQNARVVQRGESLGPDFASG